MTWGIAATWGGSSALTVRAGVGTGAGGIGQSVLVSNRFSDAVPELGQGVLCLDGALGIFSSSGGLDTSFWGLLVGCGTSTSYPGANLFTVTSIESAVDLTIGVWVLTTATMGAGAVEDGVEGVGWVSALTLYLLLEIMALFFSFVLGHGAFLTMGLVLGWAGHGWVCCGWVCCSWVCIEGLDFGPCFPSNSKYVFIFQMREG